MYAVGRLGEIAKTFFVRHLALYTALLILFAVGIGFGALATKSLSQAQRADLSQYVAGVFSSLAKNSPGMAERSTLAWKGLADSILKTAGLMWLLGLTVIGAPFVLGIVFLRGFVLGFTISFIIDELQMKGMLLSISSVLPHNLVVVPAVILAAGGALSFAASALKTLLGLTKESIYGQFAVSTGLALVSACLLAVAAVVEVFITPVFVQLSRGLLV
ncbi:MAG: stage II sporulation protein M [Firmicutes bacterium]|jgi:stage II sporulation protein M|nr:stage II sporulation protein M [Bacillota bacterium]